MLRRFLALTLFVAAAFALPARPSLAATETYKLDRPHTQVMFSILHMGFSKSYGKFIDYEGTITLNHDKKELSSVKAVIKTDSLEMNDKAWNEHLKSKDFFDVATYPEMTFTSRKVTVLSDKLADVEGDLTLHGVTKPVTLRVTFRSAGENPMAKDYRAGFSATAKIKRSDFGMTTAIPLVSDDVEIIIEVEAIRQDNAAAKATH